MPIGVVGVALGVFLFTLAPTVTAEDSGELIAAAWHFGIPHPPGYPLWTMLCGVFLRLAPLGSIAYRANLFSAVCSAGAAGLTYAVLRELGIHWALAAAGALTWIWSRWSWSQSVITEVYALNSLLTAAILYAIVRWHRTRRSGVLVVASALVGLGMSNHHTIALTAIALVIWAISREWSLLKRWKLALACVIACAVGLLPYVYLPIRANSDPAINWGDPSTPQRFWQHVTRAQYGAIGPMKTREPRSLARLGAQFGYLAGALADDMTPWLAICGTVALGWLWKARRHLFWLSLLWLLNTGLLFALLANYDLDRTSRWAMRVFLIPTSLGLIIPLTLLLDQLRALIGARSAGHPLVGFTASALLVVAAPASVLAANWRQCDYSNYWYAYDHAQNLLRCMLPGAIIFPSGDHSTFPLVYLTKVEGQRPDVLIADIYGYTDPELYRDRPEDSPESPESWLIKTARRPVYYVTKSASPVENASFVPAGMLYHLLPHDMPFDSAGLLQRCSYRNLRVPTVADFGATQILVDYAFFRGVDALRAHDEEAALQHFAHAARLGYGIKEVFNNIGSALGEHGLIEPSITYFRGAAALDKYYKMPRWNLYRSYKQTGRLHEAEQVLREILAADPDDARARTESTRTRPEPR